MAKKNLKIDQLAKLRQFREGDDVGVFLSTQFRQVVRALEQAYVKTDDGVTSSGNGYVVSPSSGLFVTQSSTPVDVTNLQVQIQSTGRPIMLCLTPAEPDAFIGIIGDLNVNIMAAYFSFRRNGTEIGNSRLGIFAPSTTNTDLFAPSSSLQCFDANPGQGLLTYSLKMYVFATTPATSGYCARSSLVAYQI